MTLFILCMKIFFARVIDVTFGVFRVVVTVKGKSLFAAIMAFFEVFIWFIIAKEALNTEMTSIFIPIAYAGGFASGTYIGSFLANRFIKGVIGVQVITDKLNQEMIDTIRENGFAVSIINLHQVNEGPMKKMLFIQINSPKLKKLTNLIKSLDEKAFIVVNDTKYVQNGFLK